jgi:hypothetical protein
VTELGDQPAGRLERQEQQPQQRGLAGAGGAGEKLEGMRLDAEREVAQDLRPVERLGGIPADLKP